MNLLRIVKDHLAASVIKKLRYRNRALLRAMHEKVLATPPLRCNPDAPVEVHTLTAHHHLTMYLTAIKSLLRYHDDVAVVVHDDGSLDGPDQAHLQRHVPGIRIIARRDADARMQPMLAALPHARDLRGRVVNALELFDNILLARTDRLVNMNSDVLFLREPRELCEWLAGNDPSIAGVYEERPARQQEFLQAHGCPFPPHVTTALSCLHQDLHDLPFVEEVLARSTPDWFTAQNVYPLLFHRQAATRNRPVRYFDQQAYQSSGVFPDGAVFRHYWTSTGWFTKLQAGDSQKVMTELCGS
jgi:hypothetical protein